MCLIHEEKSCFEIIKLGEIIVIWGEKESQINRMVLKMSHDGDILKLNVSN